MNLDDLFIPPPGAMQFHIQRSHLGEQDQTCWVLAGIPYKPVDDAVRLPGCQCIEWFEIIHHDNPTMEMHRLRLNEGQYFMICKCFGRLVE